MTIINKVSAKSVMPGVTAVPDVVDAPTIGTATDVGTSRAYNNGAATVAFTAAATGGTATSYTAISTPGSLTASGASSPLTVTGLSSGTAYTFKTYGANASGTWSAVQSSASNSITATTVPNAPTIGVPTVATGQSYTGNANVSVPFTPGATGGKSVSTYTVTSSSGNTNTGASSPITVSDVVGTARTYTVTATNANGTSTASSASAATTPSSVPQAPTIGTATAGNASATVAYTAGATGGSAVTTYTATSSPGNFTGTGASPITVSGLTNGTSYTFTVTATNANGTSAASSASSSVTPVEPYWIVLERYNTAGNMDGVAITVDSSGNVYSAARGDNNTYGYLFKYNSAGVNQLQNRFGASTDNIWGLATDSTGNLYLAGSFVSSNKDMFAGKYNSSGSAIWGKRQYTASDDQGYGVAVDSSGNVFSVGQIFWSSGQGCIAKYDSSGTLQWKNYFGAGNSDEYRSVGVDSSGNSYAVGNGTKTQVFGYIAKYNSSGTIQWQREMAAPNSSYSVYAYGSTTNSSGTTTVVGKFQPNATRSADAFIMQYNSNGVLLWQSQLYGPNASDTQGFTSVAEDASGNVYAAGWFQNSSTSRGSLLIAKYNSSGTIQWQRTLGLSSSGTISQTNIASIAVLGSSLYVTTNVYDLGNSGWNSGFVAKLPTDGTKTGTITFSTLGQTLTYAASSSLVSFGTGPTDGAATYWTTGTETTATDGTLTPAQSTSSMSLSSVSI